MPDGADPLEWGEARAIEDHRETLGAHGRRTSTRGSASARSSTPAPSTATLADLRASGVRLRRRRRRVAAQRPTSATTRTACSSSPTASSPTCCPTSPTTATSSPAASTCSSTCGAPTTTATSPRMKAAMQALGHDADELEVVDHPARRSCCADGEPVKLSKRTGDIIELRERARRGRARRRPAHLPAAVDRHAADLRPRRRRRARPMDNPVFYVQMAHARHPVDRRGWPPSAASSACRSTTSTSSLLVHERELDVLRALSELPEVVAGGRRRPGAAQASRPGCASWPARSTASTTTAT